jgi:hypothetical protein
MEVACSWHAANGTSFDRLAHIVFTVAANGCKWNSGDFAVKSE